MEFNNDKAEAAYKAGICKAHCLILLGLCGIEVGIIMLLQQLH